MGSDTKLRIAFAEPVEVIRIGLINTFREFDFVVETGSGADMIDRLAATPDLPNLCIVALNTAAIGGYAVMEEIRKRYADMPILAFSSLSTAFNAICAIQKGANGYLLKTAPVKEIKDAICAVSAQGHYYSALASRQVFRDFNRGIIKPFEFSERENLFISYLATGWSMGRIADKMGIGPRALDGVRDRLYRRLNINSRDALVALAHHRDLPHADDKQFINP